MKNDQNKKNDNKGTKTKETGVAEEESTDMRGRFHTPQRTTKEGLKNHCDTTAKMGICHLKSGTTKRERRTIETERAFWIKS